MYSLYNVQLKYDKATQKPVGKIIKVVFDKIDWSQEKYEYTQF